VIISQSGESWRKDIDDEHLHDLVRKSPLPVCLLRLDDGRVLEVSDSMTALLGGSREELVQRVATDFVVDAAAARTRMGLVAGSKIDSYQVLSRSYRRLDGSEFVMDAAVSTCAADESCRMAIGALFAPDDSPLPSARATEPSDLVVLGTVDADWRVDRISADVEAFLGLSASRVVAQSVSSLVFPGDWPGLLVGAGQGLKTLGGASLRLRLRTADGSWRHCRMLITGLASGLPESLGFAFAITDPAWARTEDRARELENLIDRIARELAATGVLARLFGMPAAAQLPDLAGLSSREIEIVTALLSESTVRNHLTAVYRKLGVRSQQQLLTLLRQERMSDNSGHSA
jgi:PAS domain S-box-containing protein